MPLEYLKSSFLVLVEKWPIFEAFEAYEWASGSNLKKVDSDHRGTSWAQSQVSTVHVIASAKPVVLQRSGH